MILEYHRPTDLQDALRLLSRSMPLTKPLAGGTHLLRERVAPYAVVDLQALGLDQVTESGQTLDIGAVCRLQALYEHGRIPAAIKQMLQREYSNNQRNAGTLGGLIISADGRSAALTCLSACDALLTWEPETKSIRLGEWLVSRGKINPGRLLTSISIPVDVRLGVEIISRTPKDLPILAVAVAQWKNGRTRLVVGGFGAFPSLAMDGSTSSGAAAAARNACAEAGDAWGSAEYRTEMAAVLAERILSGLEKGGGQ